MLASIIITNYNYSKFLNRCLRSCINQNLPKRLYEIIFIDDASTDNSLKIIKSYLKFNENLIILKNKKNIGVSASANKAILSAKGKYFVRVDADDFINESFLTILTSIFEECYPDKLGVACDYYLVNQDSNKIKIVSSKTNPISCGILYNKNKFINLGLYNNKFRHREEEEIRKRLGKKYNIFNLNYPLYRYQMHPQNKTKSLSFKKKFNKKIFSLSNQKDIYQRYLKYSSGVIAVIPARAGSKRFKYKNMQKIWGKPMIYWTINEAKQSSYINEIYVTSDSDKILNFAKKNKIKSIQRPKSLADKDTPKMEAVNHAVKTISKNKKINLVVSLQANSPNITHHYIDKCINHLIINDNDEVISVDENFNQNGAIRVMKYPYNYQRGLSTNVGFEVTDIADIHYKRDLNKLENNAKQIQKN